MEAAVGHVLLLKGLALPPGKPKLVSVLWDPGQDTGSLNLFLKGHDHQTEQGGTQASENLGHSSLHGRTVL